MIVISNLEGSGGCYLGRLGNFLKTTGGYPKKCFLKSSFRNLPKIASYQTVIICDPHLKQAVPPKDKTPY